MIGDPEDLLSKDLGVGHESVRLTLLKVELGSTYTVRESSLEMQATRWTPTVRLFSCLTFSLFAFYFPYRLTVR